MDAARIAAANLAGFGDRPVIRLYMDSTLTEDNVQIDVRRAERLSAMPNLITVVGPSESRATLAAAPVYDAAGVPQVNPQASSHLLARLNGRTLMMIPDDSIEGDFIVQYLAQELGVHTLSIFFANDEYGIGLREGVEAAAAARGLHVVDKVPFSAGGAFPVLVRASFQRAHPDVVVVAGSSASTAEIAQAVHEVAPGTPVVAGDGAMRAESLSQLGDSALAALHVVSFWLPSPDDTEATAFSHRFRALFGRDPDPFDAYLYDGIMVSAAAIRAVGPSRNAVWEWLRSLGTSTPPYRGVTGPVALGARATSHMVMARIHNGRPVAEWRR